MVSGGMYYLGFPDTEAGKGVLKLPGAAKQPGLSMSVRQHLHAVPGVQSCHILLAFQRKDLEQINIRLLELFELIQGYSHDKTPAIVSRQKVRWITPRGAVCEFQPFLMCRARDQMVVDHTGGLHEGVHDGGADKIEACLFQGSGHGVGFWCGYRHLCE